MPIETLKRPFIRIERCGETDSGIQTQGLHSETKISNMSDKDWVNSSSKHQTDRHNGELEGSEANCVGNGMSREVMSPKVCA